MTATPENVLQTSGLPWEAGQAPGKLGDVYRWRSLQLHNRLSLSRIGAHLEELPSGACSCPLHFHCVEEECFFLLEGELVVRELPFGDDQYREFVISAGDLVSYAPGVGLAHQFWNRSSTSARFLSLSTRVEGDICVYPDTGKVLIAGAKSVGVWGQDQRASGVELIERARARGNARTVRSVAPPEHVTRGVGSWETHAEPAKGFVPGRTQPRGSLFAFEDQTGLARSQLHFRTYGEELMLVISGTPELHQVVGGVECIFRLNPGDLVHWPPGDQSCRRVVHDTPARCLYVGVSPPYEVVRLIEDGALNVSLLGGTGFLDAVDYWAGS